jgi:ParB/RepB/Spo0J family partition protein
MAEIQSAVEQVRPLPIELVHESPTNPRKTFPAQDELVASVAAKGILSPLLVRPKGDAFEVCFGHRRLRAAREAGLLTVPAIVRVMEDADFEDAQLIENIQRQDLTELEEADSYARLLEKGHTGEEIAAKVGKTKAYVYARAKLAELGKEGRNALATGDLDPSTAVLLARLPAKLQRNATLDLVEKVKEGHLETYRERKQHLFWHVFRQLDRAAWAHDDAELVPEAGACSTCPKGSIANEELRGGARGSGVCTDLECWDRKAAAVYQLKVENVKIAGGRAMTSKEEKGAFTKTRWDGGKELDRSKWLPMGHVVSYGKGGRAKTLRDVANEKGLKLTPVVVQHDGEVLEVVSKDEADRVLPKAREVDWNERNKKQEANARKKRQAQEAELERLHAAVLATGAVPRKVLELVAQTRSYLLPRKLTWKGALGNVPDAELAACVAVVVVANATNSGSQKALEELVGSIVPAAETQEAPAINESPAPKARSRKAAQAKPKPKAKARKATKAKPSKKKKKPAKASKKKKPTQAKLFD